MNEITKSKIIVSFDVSEKELARANDNGARCSKRSLNRPERTSIRALVAYKAYTLNIEIKTVEYALADHFGFETPECIDASQYDEAVAFLVNFEMQ